MRLHWQRNATLPSLPRQGRHGSRGAKEQRDVHAAVSNFLLASLPHPNAETHTVGLLWTGAGHAMPGCIIQPHYSYKLCSAGRFSRVHSRSWALCCPQRRQPSHCSCHCLAAAAVANQHPPLCPPPCFVLHVQHSRRTVPLRTASWLWQHPTILWPGWCTCKCRAISPSSCSTFRLTGGACGTLALSARWCAGGSGCSMPY